MPRTVLKDSMVDRKKIIKILWTVVTERVGRPHVQWFLGREGV